MIKRKCQQDKATHSNKKIWLIHISYVDDLTCLNKTNEIYNDNHTNDLVYVVDNSMANAIKKATYYFGKRTGIKKLKLKRDKAGFVRNIIKISIRRATKMEVVIMRAGIGYKELEVI